MAKNDQHTPLSTFLHDKKPTFQRLGQFGCIVSASILGVLAVSFVVGMTLALSRSSSMWVSWSGPMPWRYTGGSFMTLLMAMVSMWGYLCFNAIFAHRLFCAYKKGCVFSVANTHRLILLGVFNLFLCSVPAGIFYLILAIILPDHEAA